MKIYIEYNDKPMVSIDDVKFFTFSGGEVHIQLPDLNCADTAKIRVTTRITNSDGVMELLFVTDALRRKFGTLVPIYVTIPYLPYARQDKISANGESLSLKVFADLINSQNYTKVITYDAHSDVASALINNLQVITQKTIVHYVATSRHVAHLLLNKVLIIPDHGASKKSYQLGEVLSPSEFVQVDKARDEFGNIVKTKVFSDDLTGKDCLIVDDITDGGRSFIEITKELKQLGAKTVTLFTTHGIYSKGVECIYESGIDNIITTDTFRDNYNSTVNCIPVVDRLF
jgi:ribose-phosphate pyrophosphokinase